MRTLRVASVFGALQMGGDENRCLAFARHAPADVHHEVLVLSRPTSERNAAFGDMPGRYAAHGVGLRVLGLPARTALRAPLARLLASPVLLAWSARRLRRWLLANAIDVVDARLTTGMTVAALACAGLPIAVVGTDYFPDWWQRGEGRAARRAVFAGLDALVTDSIYMGARFDALLPGRVRVIHNGVPEPRSAFGPAEARARLGLPRDALVMSHVARLIPYKGQRDTLEAAAPVLRKLRRARLVLCGFDGQAPGFADELRRRAAALGLSERVRVGGYHGSIADIWAATDVQLHPSHRDSSPISVHEAMAAGIPSVVSDVSGVPELVEHGASGFVLARGDLAGVSARALQLLEDPALRARFGSEARRRWERRHQPEHMVAQTVALFREVASARRGGRAVA